MAPPAAPAPAPAAPAAPTPKFTWGGLVDTYYMYNFIHGDGQNSLLEVGGSGVVNRAFDTNSNSLTMALAKLSLNASIDPVAFQIDIGYGSTGTIINAANSGYATVPFTGSAPPTGAIPGSFLLEQAFGTISLPGNLTLDFGKFVTTAGAEVIEANKNWLYSRSLLFNIIPLLHTGARLNLKINDMLTVQGSVVNGWNNDPDNNAWKTIGLSATLTLNPMISIIATTYLGKESSAGVTPDGFNALADLVAAFTLSDKLGLNLNFDYISAPFTAATATTPQVASGDDHQVGVSLMGRFVVSDHLNLAARGEFLQNHFGGVNVNQEEFTAMAGIDVGKNFELRPELRVDLTGDPGVFNNTKKNEFTGTLAALTWF
jgi:hypothetical protein